MRNRALAGNTTLVNQNGPARRRLPGASAIIFLAFAGSVVAQGTVPDGDYVAVFKGTVHYTDRQPAEQQIVEQTTLKVSSSGNTVTIDVGQIGSAMSATRFLGTSGNASFIAMHSVPGKENQATLLWGNIRDGNTLRGTLLYPRVAAGLVPGFTELEFEAKSGALGNSSASSPTPRNRMPSTSSSSDLKSRFPRASSSSGSPSVSSEKPKKELKPKQPTAPVGSSVISGTITGDIGVVRDVQLVDAASNTLKTTTLDQNGRYRFENLGAGRFWIYVNDGRAEAWISTTRGNREVNVNGHSNYRVDFDVKN